MKEAEKAASRGGPERGPESATLSGAVQAFLLSRRVGNATAKTLRVYEMNLMRFAEVVGFFVGDRDRNDMTMQIRDPASPPIIRVTPEIVERYLDGLRQQERSIVLPDGEERVERRLTVSTVHQHYRCLKTFFRWCVEAGLLDRTPLRVKMKLPQTLPRTPDDETVALLLKHAGTGFHGARNRLLITLFCDSGLRLTELLRVRLSDVNLATRTLRITGKGGVDDLQPIGQESATLVREYTKRYRWNTLEDALLIATEDGAPLRPESVTHILATISKRAGLPHPVSPHKLRHYFGTQVLIQTGDLELTRQLLRHRTLTMSLQYAKMTKMDVLKKFRMASPIDHLKRRRGR